jgi:hypothetical protein
MFRPTGARKFGAIVPQHRPYQRFAGIAAKQAGGTNSEESPALLFVRSFPSTPSVLPSHFVMTRQLPPYGAGTDRADSD